MGSLYNKWRIITLRLAPARPSILYRYLYNTLCGPHILQSRAPATMTIVSSSRIPLLTMTDRHSGALAPVATPVPGSPPC
jgi:hypothetical protein